VAGSGNWNISGNWANAVIPNAAGAEADFLDAIASPRTVYSDTPVTVGTLVFNNANTYVIGGAGSLTLQATSGGTAQVIVQAGTQEINLPLTIASNTTFNVTPGATLVIADPMTISAGMTLTQTGGGSIVYESTVTLLSGASMITSADAASVRGQITSGQLVSGAAAEVVGYTDVGGGQMLVRSTVLGDTNLDGKVDVADLGNLATNYGDAGGAGWSQGDFNYDGSVDVTDLGDLATNYGSVAAAPMQASPQRIVAVSTPAIRAVAVPATVESSSGDPLRAWLDDDAVDFTSRAARARHRS
jgi:hypothetical protein